jgi:hypothetical protein
MTELSFDEFALGKINVRNKNKFEYRYPKETEIIINLLKQAIAKRAETQLNVYNYVTIRDYCREVLGFTMVSKEGLRKIISRIAQENGCEL